MQIPRSLISNYTKGINGLSASAQAGIANVMSRFEFSDDIAADRNRIISLMESTLRPYTDNVTRYSLAFYNLIRELSVGESLDVAVAASEVRNPEATAGAVRAFMQEAVDGKPERIPKLLTERIDYELKKAAAETVFKAGQRDSKRVKFARVPSGAETCEFCLMLASRGFVYDSKETAGENGHYHANCDCRIVPSFAKDTVEGYDPAALYEQYKTKMAIGNLGIREDVDVTVPCLLDTKTKKIVKTIVSEVPRRDLSAFNAGNGWDFNWKELGENTKVFALRVIGDDEVHGLAALEKDEGAKAVYVRYLKSAPHSDMRMTDKKRYDGIGGHLFAIAVNESVNAGYGGAIYGDAANKRLLEYYVEKFGAEVIGMPHPYRFFVDEDMAVEILNEYNFTTGG